MTLDISALDAVLGALATAFFGGLVAAEAYLLRQVLGVQNELREVKLRLERLQPLEDIVGQTVDRLNRPQPLTGAVTNEEVR